MVDPYDWLGIPKQQRPPTYYQLLGVPSSVSASVAIREAAVRQLSKLMPHMDGPHALSAQRLQREINEARDTLLDPEQRRLYDILTPSSDPEPAKPTATLPVATIAPEPTPSPPKTGGPSEWWREVSSEPAPANVSGQPWWKEGVPVEADAPPPPPPMPVPVPVQAPVSPKPVPKPVAVTNESPALTGMNRPIRRGKQGSSMGGLIVAGVLLLGAVGIAVVALKQSAKSTPSTPLADASKNTDKEQTKQQGKNDTNTPTPDVGTPIEIDPPGPPPKDFFEELQAKTLKGHTRAVVSVAVSRNGSRCISIGEDKSIRIWSIAKEAAVVRHTFTSPGVGLALSSDDAKIIACDSPALAVMDAHKSSMPKSVDSPQGGFMALAASADGSQALAGVSNGDLRLFNTETLKYQEWPSGNNRVTAVALTGDGKSALTAVADGPVTLWATGGRSKMHSWDPHGGGTIAVQFSPDGKLAATGGSDTFATVYDLAKRKEVGRLKGHIGAVTGLAWLSDSRRIITCSTDGTVRLWNAENGQSLRWTQTLAGKLLCVAVDPANQVVVVGSTTGSVHVLPLPRIRSEALPNTLATAPIDPLPLPPSAEVAAANKELRNSLTVEFGYNRPDDRLVLADNLYRRAQQENVPPPMRFTLLHEARSLAALADDPDLAFRINHTFAAWFEIDELAEAVTLCSSLAGRSDPKALLLALLDTLEKGERNVRYDVVVPLIKKLPADNATPEELKPRVNGARIRLQASIDEENAVTQALATLKSATTEPNANLVLGRYLCFARQDWTAGVPYLARGNDATLRDAANAELGRHTEPKAQFQMGEAWFKLAVKMQEPRTRQAMFLRAKYWFEKSAKVATELTDQVRAKARIDDVDKANVPSKDPNAPIIQPAVVIRKHFNTVASDAVNHEWKIAGEAEFQPAGVRFKAAQPTLTSRFEIGDGTRLMFTIAPDGRDLKFMCNGEEHTVAGTGGSLLVVLERRGNTLVWSHRVDQGKPVSKSIDLPATKQGTSAVELRLNGMPKLTEGALVTAIVVRGPVQFVAPKPE